MLAQAGETQAERGFWVGPDKKECKIAAGSLSGAAHSMGGLLAGLKRAWGSKIIHLTASAGSELWCTGSKALLGVSMEKKDENSMAETN